MSDLSALETLYDANNAGIWLWLENDRLKFKVPDDADVTAIMERLKLHRDVISAILQHNAVTNSTATEQLIYRLPGNTAALSFAQERLWFVEQYEAGTNAYHVPSVYELAAGTDKEGIRHALQQIVLRHEVLRSTIAQESGAVQAIQRVHEAPLVIGEVVPGSDADHWSMIKADIDRPFDLRTEYPLRARFYTLPDKTLLLINLHHIASDGWSSELFEQELFAFYNAYTGGDKEFRLPGSGIQYKDYALWQRSALKDGRLEKQLQYWENKLAGWQPLELPLDFQRPSRTDYKGRIGEFVIGEALGRRLKAFAQKEGATVHSVLLAALHVLLGKYTGQEDIVTGSPNANRHHPQTEHLIGFFINTQVNRTVLDKTQRFSALVRQVQQDQAEAQLHQDLPFEKLVDRLKVERDASRNPVFQVIFAVQQYDDQNKNTAQQNNYLRAYPLKDFYDVEKVDLSIYIDDSRDEMKGLFSYATSLFRESTVTGFIDRYILLLGRLLESVETPYSRISMLRDEEYSRIMHEWSNAGKEYEGRQTLHGLFEAQAAKDPGSIALFYEGQQLTYGELNEKSNRLAALIRKRYEQRNGAALLPDTLVALCLDRGPEMITAMLAVLKAGAAYMPVDPAYPQERIRFMLDDSAAALILSGQGLNALLQLPQERLLLVDEEPPDDVGTADNTAYCNADDLAYVIYTSGTTGRPKGVMISHKSAVNLVSNQVRGFELLPGNRGIQFASYVFDAAVSEIFTVLAQGATLYIAPAKVRQDAHLLRDYLQQHRINVATMPPVLLGAMPYSALPDLKTLVVAGEACPAELMKQWAQGRRLINAYGPTENAVCTTMHVYSEGDSNTTIGKPLEHVQVYVLDDAMNPLPAQVKGELYIGGAGLARGYLNRDALTAERFVPSPFAAGERLYRTGDLVRWLPGGSLEFIGRNDGQVKIRGYRIETAEIEQVLSGIEGIRQCCVMARERQTATGITSYLAAYYVAGAGIATEQSAILQQLQGLLPDYMLPAALVKLEAFPLTINGKINKQALPDPELAAAADDGYVAPVSEAEKKVCRLWQEAIGVERVGVTDDFFRIGGNSILAIQVSHLMGEALGADVEVADLFEYTTCRELLAYMDTKNKTMYVEGEL